MKIKRGSTSVRRLIFIGDSTSTTGAGLTGLVYNSAGLTAYYFAGDLSNEVQITLATATLGSYTSGGFVEVDATNMPGWYEVGIPDAALDGGNEVAIQYRGATNMVPVNIYIELDAVDYQSATNFGLSKFADIETDTQDIQSRLPASLVDGRLVVLVEAMTANVLTASALASDAVAEIQSGLSTLDAAGIRTAVGLASANLDTQLSTIDTVVDNIEVDTQDIQSRLPAALVGGRIDASIGAMAANTLTASALATDAAAEIADAVWDEPYSQHTSSGSFGKLMDIIRKANLTIDGEITGAITPTTLTFSSNISSVTSSYAHAVLLFVTGALEGENSPIISYNNTNGVFVLEEPLTAAPSVGDEFVVIAGSHVHSIADIQQGLATSAEAAAIQAVVDAIELDTQNIQSRLPNALVGGRIDAYASNLEDIATNSQTPILERSVSDDQSINFTWPVSGATITANVSIDNGTLTPVAGTISFLRTESTGKNVYSLSYDAADRPSSEGHARYILTDGTYTRSFSVRISDTANQVFSSGDVDGYSLEEALKIMLAALAGKVTGGGTTSIVFRAADDSKDRITATVTSAGNRTSITLDADG